MRTLLAVAVVSVVLFPRAALACDTMTVAGDTPADVPQVVVDVLCGVVDRIESYAHLAAVRFTDTAMAEAIAAGGPAIDDMLAQIRAALGKTRVLVFYGQIKLATVRGAWGGGVRVDR